MSLLTGFVLFSLLLGSLLGESAHAAPPNFLVILTDDHGYGDVSIYGAKDVQTPNIDRIGKEGMVFTIEPMLNQGVRTVRTEDDGWTVTTADGKLSAQFEHTVAVTANGVRVLTLRPDEKRGA